MASELESGGAGWTRTSDLRIMNLFHRGLCERRERLGPGRFPELAAVQLRLASEIAADLERALGAS
jgi:hypothetical protein